MCVLLHTFKWYFYIQHTLQYRVILLAFKLHSTHHITKLQNNYQIPYKFTGSYFLLNESINENK